MGPVGEFLDIGKSTSPRGSYMGNETSLRFCSSPSFFFGGVVGIGVVFQHCLCSLVLGKAPNYNQMFR